MKFFLILCFIRICSYPTLCNSDLLNLVSLRSTLWTFIKFSVTQNLEVLAPFSWLPDIPISELFLRDVSPVMWLSHQLLYRVVEPQPRLSLRCWLQLGKSPSNARPADSGTLMGMHHEIACSKTFSSNTYIKNAQSIIRAQGGGRISEH